MRIILSLLSLLFAFALGLAASHLLFSCFLPWRQAPDTTHMTLIIAGVQFTGWQMLIPIVFLAAAAIGAGFLGFWILKRRPEIRLRA